MLRFSIGFDPTVKKKITNDVTTTNSKAEKSIVPTKESDLITKDDHTIDITKVSASESMKAPTTSDHNQIKDRPIDSSKNNIGLLQYSSCDPTNTDDHKSDSLLITNEIRKLTSVLTKNKPKPLVSMKTNPLTNVNISISKTKWGQGPQNHKTMRITKIE